MGVVIIGGRVGEERSQVINQRERVESDNDNLFYPVHADCGEGRFHCGLPRGN